MNDRPPNDAYDTSASILELRGLTVRHGHGHRSFAAVDAVDLLVPRNGTLGLVGESGCGKSTLARSIVGLNAVSGGTILLDGADATPARIRHARAFRRRVQLVFQDPNSSLNPRMSIKDMLAEALRVRSAKLSSTERTNEAKRVLDLVGLSSTALERYPHQFSGGQRQRLAIARALAVAPDVLILDEVTSALDVSVQATILNLLKSLQHELGLSMIFISHDLAVVRYISDMVGVMYLGQIVERAPTSKLFATPGHPYTQALLRSVPRMAKKAQAVKLMGDPPDPRDPPSGCRYHTRCAIGPMVHPERTICVTQTPAGRESRGHPVACHFAHETETPNIVLGIDVTDPSANEGPDGSGSTNKERV